MDKITTAILAFFRSNIASAIGIFLLILGLAIVPFVLSFGLFVVSDTYHDGLKRK